MSIEFCSSFVSYQCLNFRPHLHTSLKYNIKWFCSFQNQNLNNKKISAKEQYPRLVVEEVNWEKVLHTCKNVYFQILMHMID